jgi:hypothetical protein
VTDWDKDHVDLKWSPPREDGGAPITGYVVEKKDKFGNWEKALEVPAGQTTCTVPDLVEGQTYEFRSVTHPLASLLHTSYSSVHCQLVVYHCVARGGDTVSK